MADIYLDNNATTACDPKVVEAMLPYFLEQFGNPSSIHSFGSGVGRALARARKQIQALLGAKYDSEIILTSCGTESDNTAILSALKCYPSRKEIITTVVEHPAVLALCEQLEKDGYTIHRLRVDSKGRLDLDEYRRLLTPNVAIVSVMWANNETGTFFPVVEMAELAHAAGIQFHTDAVQAVGHVPFDVEALGVDLASMSAHKMYGPKGVGALYVRRSPKVALEPQTVGGGQEQGLRAGTLNVPAIVGFGVAAAIAREGLAAEHARVAALRDRLLAGLTLELEGVAVTGPLAERLPHNLHVRFAGVDGEALMTSLADDVAVSSGAACASGSREPSHVMTALGLDVVDRWGAVRFGLGRGTSADEIDRAVACVVERVTRLRALSPVGVGGRA